LGDKYTKIFEVSYFGAGGLGMPLLFLAIGVLGLVTIGRKKTSHGIENVSKRGFYLVWVPLWFGTTLVWLFSAVHHTHEFTMALKEGRCAVVEGTVSDKGTVSVLREQPRSGHASGDRIRIGDKEFVYSYFVASPGYRTTVSHGGALVNGASARLHYLGEAIVKVEVKK
jgi:hypothetical protein